MQLGLKLILISGLVSSSAWGEALRPIAVLETTDSAGWNVATRLQNALAERFTKSRLFEAQTHPLSLTAYTPEALKTAYDQTRTELLSFAYVDKERIALFLFDYNRPGRYIATSEAMVGSPTGRITNEWLDARFGLAFTTLLRRYAAGDFEAIPSQEPEGETTAEPEMSRDEKGRRLFQELSKLQDGSLYIGTHIGMARFESQGRAASTVNVGLFSGIKLYDRLRLEAGVDLFSYMLLHGDVRVTLPIAERYVALNLGVSVNHITATVTQNRGFNPTFVRTGQVLFGPTLSFDVPLLGASVRGDIKALFGETTILLATYGLAYTL